ncbi:MAG: envelope stress response membrane protein PspB [Proteobacteria bacterium]|nr:envelope stress response membrane protein PspB [Pseudomonadota bacterium]
MEETVPILIFTLVVPLWLILHYVTKWKKDKTITPENESTLGDLRANAEKLEQRLIVMERILDDEIPEWRQRAHDPL